MPPEVFDSLDAMISRDGMRRILGHVVDAVECRPLEVDHLSGNTLEQLRAWRRGRESRFVLKHFHPEADWIMPLTHDWAVREVVCRLLVSSSSMNSQTNASEPQIWFIRQVNDTSG